jgi:hypothetical protein
VHTGSSPCLCNAVLGSPSHAPPHGLQRGVPFGTVRRYGGLVAVLSVFARVPNGPHRFANVLAPPLLLGKSKLSHEPPLNSVCKGVVAICDDADVDEQELLDSWHSLALTSDKLAVPLVLRIPCRKTKPKVAAAPAEPSPAAQKEVVVEAPASPIVISAPYVADQPVLPRLRPIGPLDYSSVPAQEASLATTKTVPSFKLYTYDQGVDIFVSRKHAPPPKAFLFLDCLT